MNKLRIKEAIYTNNKININDIDDAIKKKLKINIENDPRDNIYKNADGFHLSYELDDPDDIDDILEGLIDTLRDKLEIEITKDECLLYFQLINIDKKVILII